MARPGKLLGRVKEARKKAKREGWAEWIRSDGDEEALTHGCYFDIAAAEHFEEFCNNFLCLSKGRWAGEPFTFLEWQRRDLFYPLFGWMRENGTRRYRRGYTELPKKNSKSTSASAIALYMLVGDGEAGAECYTCANDRDQARLVWNPAADMVESSPHLVSRLDVRRATTVIRYGNNSWFKAWSAEASSKDGPDIHLAIVDELHAWKGKGRELWEKIKGGGAARLQPLCPFVITTAGSNMNTLCGEQHVYAEKIIKGDIFDFASFALIYAADKEKIEDDPEYWKTEEAFASCNPSYGHIMTKGFFEDRVREAENNPAEVAAYQRYHLNVWTGASNPWIPADVWDSNPLCPPEEELAGGLCYAGLDLATTQDIAALKYCFPFEDGSYAYTARLFCPEDTIEERSRKDNIRYDVWADQGHLLPTPGRVIDYDYILATLQADGERFDIAEIAYDRYGATQLIQDLDDLGFKVIPFSQGIVSFTAPCKEYFKLLLEKRIRRADNPVVDWMAGNVVVEMDHNGNIKPSKKKSSEKIDGIVAGIMALDRAIRNESEPKESIYETQDIEIF